MAQVPLPLGATQTFVLGGQILNICLDVSANMDSPGSNSEYSCQV